MIDIYKVKSVVYGHAVGDALGVPAEFKSRNELDAHPVTQMTGYGTYSVPEGTWSDDTSMALCALDSLNKGKIDYDEIMDNFGKWLTDSQYTATGVTFDVGIASKNAIIDYHSHGMPYDRCGQASVFANGNGSLMRIYPFVLFLQARDGELTAKNSGDAQSGLDVIFAGSALTHAHERSKIGCAIYAYILMELLNNPCRDSVFAGLYKAEENLSNSDELKSYSRIFHSSFAELPRDEIKSSGYVVESLEAAVWCLLTTKSYNECVLKAVNLGEDTDTVGAIAGSLAGALYGYDSIPSQWLCELRGKELLDRLCNETAQMKL